MNITVDWLIVGACLLAVAAIAGAIAWWVRGSLATARVTLLEGRVADAERQLAERAAAVAAWQAQYGEAVERLREETERRAIAEAQLGEERKAAADKLALLKQAETALTDSFKALSGEALKSNNLAFLQLANATLTKFQEGAQSDLDARRKAVDELVKPVHESLAKVDGKLGEIEKARVEAYSALDVQLRNLIETHLPQLHSETANLVKALRQPAVRGRWGEIQLKRVVEMAGMVTHCDFIEQASSTTENGRLRPDLIVHLPGGKQVVVDSKAPFAAYIAAVETTDEAEQRRLLGEHARQVKDHMIKLGRKGYWEQFSPTPEFVVLFLPGEAFFSAALQHDPELIEFGVNERVIPATPTTLIALLRAVAYGWRQESLAKNAQQVAELGRQLYERISVLAGHWGDVGRRLDKAVEAYNKSVGTLESRVLVTARRLHELEAVPSDAEIDTIEPVERTARELSAPEITDTLDDRKLLS